MLACLGWTRTALFLSRARRAGRHRPARRPAGRRRRPARRGALGLHASAWPRPARDPGRGRGRSAGRHAAGLARRPRDPIASVRPPVLDVRRGSNPRTVTTMAAHQCGPLARPGPDRNGQSRARRRGADGAHRGHFAFRGVVVGSLLGDAVACPGPRRRLHRRHRHLDARHPRGRRCGLLNITERSGELATLRAFGWRESALGRLVVTEGAIIGLAGSLAALRSACRRRPSSPASCPPGCSCSRASPGSRGRHHSLRRPAARQAPAPPAHRPTSRRGVAPILASDHPAPRAP